MKINNNNNLKFHSEFQIFKYFATNRNNFCLISIRILRQLIINFKQNNLKAKVKPKSN